MTGANYEIVTKYWVFMYEGSRMQEYRGRRPRTKDDPSPTTTYMWEQKGTTWVGVRS